MGIAEKHLPAAWALDNQLMEWYPLMRPTLKSTEYVQSIEAFAVGMFRFQASEGTPFPHAGPVPTATTR